MTRPEWNRCFAWMMAQFPGWKPDAGVAAVWYRELGARVDAARFARAFRAAAQKGGGAWPPNLPQIAAAVALEESGDDPRLVACEEWVAALSGVEPTDERTKRALRAVGGQDRIRMTDYAELKWVEKKFLEVWMLAHDAVVKRAEIQSSPRKMLD